MIVHPLLAKHVPDYRICWLPVKQGHRACSTSDTRHEDDLAGTQGVQHDGHDWEGATEEASYWPVDLAMPRNDGIARRLAAVTHTIGRR